MSEKSKMTRHEAREMTFKLLFAREFDREADAGEFYRSFAENSEEPTNAYVQDTFLGVCEQGGQIDAEIEETSVKWKLSRMSVATRSILRLAVYEMIATETPVKVVLNEAVEIIKLYDDPAAPAFVNGILNTIARRHGLISETQA